MYAARVRPRQLRSCAASFHLDLPETVLGGGICGYVFACRLGGREAAVKLVPVEGAEPVLDRLSHEADVYRALRPLWFSIVPGLVATGYGRARCCYLLATTRVASDGELDLARAEHRALLPAAARALAAIHELGVLHGNLHTDNMLVVPPAAGLGPPAVMFVGFGSASLSSWPGELQREMDGLVRMFQQAAGSR